MKFFKFFFHFFYSIFIVFSDHNGIKKKGDWGLGIVDLESRDQYILSSIPTPILSGNMSIPKLIIFFFHSKEIEIIFLKKNLKKNGDFGKIKNFKLAP